MTVVENKQAEKEAILEAAKLMAVAARTAPKTKGIDNIKTAILTDPQKEELCKKMDELSNEYGFFKRDAENLRASEAVLLVGLSAEPLGLNCGACGMNCDKMKQQAKKEGKGYKGPNCIMDVLNLGIALGSVAKTASLLNIDNRLMFSIGVAARKSGIMNRDLIIGIPLSASGKNIFFDRYPQQSSRKVKLDLKK